MLILTMIFAILFTLIITAFVSGIEAFPVAGILYGILTALLGVVSLPFWSWYAISASALFLINLLFKRAKTSNEKTGD